MKGLFYGLTKADFKKVAYNSAQKNANPRPLQNGAAGDEWLVVFTRRHPGVTKHSPEPTSRGRTRGFSYPQVTRS
jgi:hypothetical protein